MSESYAKLFKSIATSTICDEPLATRWLWVVMLSQADRTGYVGGSVPGLARLANITLEECEQALSRFLSPDPYSRTKDHEGRRIEVAERGWRLLNYAKFDKQRSESEAIDRERERKREWDREHRPSGHQRAANSPTQSDAVRQQSDNSPTQSVPPIAVDVTTAKSKSKSSSGERSDDHSPPVESIPLASGDEYPVTEQQAAEFARSYPAVNVLAELRRMRAWSMANPKNRKTRGGVLRFVNAWLSKAQDNAPTARAGPQAVSKTGTAFLALDRIANGNDFHEREHFDGLALAGDSARIPALAGPRS